jgi:acyl-CoA thioesterase FadM
VAASFDFQRALRFEDEFDVHLRITELSQRTIRYECIVWRDTEAIASGTMTIACVRRTPAMRATDIPDEIARRLKADG